MSKKELPISEIEQGLEIYLIAEADKRNLSKTIKALIKNHPGSSKGDLVIRSKEILREHFGKNDNQQALLLTIKTSGYTGQRRTRPSSCSLIN
jgi:hypothetical protein